MAEEYSNFLKRSLDLKSAREERNKNLSRDKLFSKVWGYSFAGNSKTLDVHIQRIRERIEVNPKSPKRLITIRGVGYKLNDWKY